MAPLGSISKLTLEQVGARKEARAHDGVVDLVLAGGRDHRDARAALGKAELGHHLPKRERDAVLGVGGLDLLGDGRVEILGKGAVEPVDEDRVHTGLAELLDQLGADVARADHRHGLRLHGVVLDGLAVVPVLAQHHAAVLKALGQAGDRRHHGLGAGGHHELVEGVAGLLARVEVAGHKGLAGDVDGKHVGLHVHARAQVGKGGGGGVEHAVGVAHVTAHPQRDAAGQERQRVVALEHVDRPVGVRGEDGLSGKGAGVRAANNGDGFGRGGRGGGHRGLLGFGVGDRSAQRCMYAGNSDLRIHSKRNDSHEGTIGKRKSMYGIFELA